MRAGPEGRGILLPKARLALDAAAPGFATVIGHAHGDHVPPPPFSADATGPTADLVDARFLARRAAGEALPPVAWRRRDFGEPFAAGDAQVVLHPSGHVLGGALVEVRHDGQTLLYTGDFKDRPPAAGLPLDLSGLGPVDVLVTESTFGLPIFRLLGTAEAGDLLSAACREAFAEGRTPVLLAWSLGKAQEAARLLGDRGVPTVLHGAAWRSAEVYARWGLAIPQARRYEGEVRAGEALVVPPDARRHPMVTRIARRRQILVSGWARLEASRVQTDCEELVALSDHADFPGLLQTVRRLAPGRVVTNHGYADVLAHILRGEGFAAEAIPDTEAETLA